MTLPHVPNSESSTTDEAADSPGDAAAMAEALAAIQDADAEALEEQALIDELEQAELSLRTLRHRHKVLHNQQGNSKVVFSQRYVPRAHARPLAIIHRTSPPFPLRRVLL